MDCNADGMAYGCLGRACGIPRFYAFILVQLRHDQYLAALVTRDQAVKTWSSSLFIQQLCI